MATENHSDQQRESTTGLPPGNTKKILLNQRIRFNKLLEIWRKNKEWFFQINYRKINFKWYFKISKITKFSITLESQYNFIGP